MAGLYYSTNQLDSAEQYYTKVLPRALSDRRRAECNLGLGRVYVKKGELGRAEYFLNKGYEFSLKGGALLEAGAKLDLAKLYVQQEKYDKALGEITASMGVLNEEEDVFIKKNAIELFFKVYSAQNEAYDLNGWFVEYTAITDSLNSEKYNQILLDVREKYNTKIKEDSIKILQLSQENDQIIINKERNLKYFSWVALCLLGILIYFISKNLKKERNLTALLEEKNDKLVNENSQLLTDIEEARKNENPFELLKNSFLKLDNKAKTKIKLSDIVFMESRNGKVYIHTVDGTVFEDWQTLKSFLKILPKELFVQIHRAFIVNIYQLTRKPDGTLLMSTNETLTVSRGFKDLVEARLAKFVVN